jgi:hypothetical protein
MMVVQVARLPLAIGRRQAHGANECCGRLEVR